MTAITDDALQSYVHGLIGLILKRLCVPFLMLDANGRILFVNAMAEVILEDGRHITRHDVGRLACRSETSTAVIGEFLADMHLRGDEDVDILIEGGPGEAPLFASLATFRPPLFPGLAQMPPVAVVFIRAGYEEEGIEAARMLYALSEAETGAVRAVVAGTPVKQHANARNVSVHTARKQLNMAMKKAGVSSQLQLQTLIGDLTRAPD